MQKSDRNQTAVSAHRKVQTSTTLNRRYVKSPRLSRSTQGKEAEQSQDLADNAVTVSVKRSDKISRFGETTGSKSVLAHYSRSTDSQQTEEAMQPAQAHPLQVSANERMRQRNTKQTAQKLSARELKEQAIKKALASASQPLESEVKTENNKLAKSIDSSKSKKSSKSSFGKVHFGFGRVMLALACAAVAVCAIVYFVNLNMPDLSLRVAAMQTGIEASYPSYVPRDYELSDITSEDGKVVLNFRSTVDEGGFSLVEESSSWDSNALLTNYVKENYPEDYTILREQGLTLYVGGNGACWVNGGVVYKINSEGATLTKKQIKSIAVSL